MPRALMPLSHGLLRGGRRVPTWQRVATLLGAKLLGHFSGEAAQTLTLAGASVTSWTCLVSGLVVSPGDAGTRPIYDAASKALTFDGTDDFLAANSNPYFADAAEGEVFLVVNQSALPADTTARAALYLGSAASLDISRAVDRFVSGAANRVRARTGITGSSASVVNDLGDLSGKRRIGVRWSNTTTYASMDNNTEASVAAIPTTATTRTVIGAYTDATSGFWSGQVHEVIITAPLTTQERDALHALYQ